MKKIILFCLLQISFFAFAQDLEQDLFGYWLTQIGEGLEDINQPVIWLGPTTAEGKAEVKKIINSRKAREGPSFNEFLIFLSLRMVPQTLESEKKAHTMEIPKEIISKVLNRRKVLKNSFLINSDDCMSGELFHFYKGFETFVGYLEGVQLIVLEQLIANHDFRFEKEAQDLLNYLYEGKKVPPPIDYAIFISKKKQDGYAGCNINPPFITKYILYYLELCKESKN